MQSPNTKAKRVSFANHATVTEYETEDPTQKLQLTLQTVDSYLHQSEHTIDSNDENDDLFLQNSFESQDNTSMNEMEMDLTNTYQYHHNNVTSQPQLIDLFNEEDNTNNTNKCLQDLFNDDTNTSIIDDDHTLNNKQRESSANNNNSEDININEKINNESLNIIMDNVGHLQQNKQSNDIQQQQQQQETVINWRDIALNDKKDIILNEICDRIEYNLLNKLSKNIKNEITNMKNTVFQLENNMDKKRNKNDILLQKNNKI
eukprot:545739_1